MLVILLAVSVAMGAGYLGLQVLRHGGRPRRAYAIMLLADAAVGLVAFLQVKDGAPPSAQAGLLTAIAVGAFVFLVLVPPVLRDVAGRAIARDQLGLAMYLLGVCDLLQPGMGARQERETLATLAEIRAGRTDQVLEGLRRLRASTEDPGARRGVDERIIFTLLYARRWPDAVESFERTLAATAGPISAQLLVEIVRAYGEVGDVDRAAEILRRLELAAPSRSPLLAFLLLRARTVFLAFAGRATDVEAIMAPTGPLGGAVPASTRSYWIGVARFHAGDGPGARKALAEAVELARGDARARQIAAETLAAVHHAGEALPRVLSETTARTADTLAQATFNDARTTSEVPRLRGVPWRRTPVTVALIAVNVAVAVLVTMRLGSTQEVDVLVDAGANVAAAIRAGDVWRLESATFLHAGVLHLLMNMYGLWVLGRLVEQILRPVRFLALYVVAGLGGSLATFFVGDGTPSVGASGAVLGLLGAAIAELALRRQTYPESWRRALLGNLVFIAAANILIGYQVAGIDQAAHLGGLAAGVLLGAALSPRGRVGRTAAGRAVAGLLVLVSLAGVAYAAWGIGDRFASPRWRRLPVETITIEAPPRWTPLDMEAKDGGTFPVLVDARTGALLLVYTGSAPGDATPDALLQHARDEIPDLEDHEEVAPTLEVPGWRVRELRAPAEAAGDRTLLATRDAVPAADVIRIKAPEGVHAQVWRDVPRMLASARRR